MYVKSQDSSVNTPTGYGLDDQMIGFQFLAGAGNFFLRHHVQTSFGVNPPPIQWVPGAFPGSKADHSPPSSAEIKECMELYPHSPICLHGMVLR
jgi:hypothetical protein